MVPFRSGFIEPHIVGFDPELSAVGMASRALTARLSRAFSSWPGRHGCEPEVAGERDLQTDGPAEGAPQHLRHALDHEIGVTTSGASACWREKASRRLVKVAAREAPSIAESM